ncbi:hypothetical protein Bca52824_048442 [Brassica carinata]|uniref:Ubiquitin-like protease family profile domain-containing protein n=1 Tax=Brassica carinata TaxID=52824 RepID=A0A8X7RJ06_BRACI|nr:hypothetical protein Bca52824_048442 [Brassica carinata]
MPEAMGERLQVPFRVSRLGGLYQNVRSGDCRPVAVKFLEMHATGNRSPTMSGLTDDFVDIFRKHYAMDIYKGVVVPLYLNR